MEDHLNPPVLATILTGGFPSRTYGQEPGLGKRYVVNGFTFAGEFKLLFFFALVFGHGGIISGGDVGSNLGGNQTPSQVLIDTRLIIKPRNPGYHSPKFQVRIIMASHINQEDAWL